MIVRILNEGQWQLSDGAMRELSRLDDAVEAAVSAASQEDLAAALHSLLEQVRSTGTPVPDDELVDSDLILPAADATLEEVGELLSGSEEGLVPN
jgi:PspA-Associated protein